LGSKGEAKGGNGKKINKEKELQRQEEDSRIFKTRNIIENTKT